jgi:hypothetical protein
MNGVHQQHQRRNLNFNLFLTQYQVCRRPVLIVHYYRISDAMPREIDPPTIQKEFVLAALAEGKRTDGRALLQTRDVEFKFGAELGWVECRLGKTK